MYTEHMFQSDVVFSHCKLLQMYETCIKALSTIRRDSIQPADSTNSN